VRLTCDDCPRTFRTSTGLEWHREREHKVLEVTTPEETQGAAPDTTIGPHSVEESSTIAQLATPTPPVSEPTAAGDYNCLDCLGANHLGGFYLSGAVTHHRYTGHRLEHIPGSDLHISPLLGSLRHREPLRKYQLP